MVGKDDFFWVRLENGKLGDSFFLGLGRFWNGLIFGLDDVSLPNWWAGVFLCSDIFLKPWR